MGIKVVVTDNQILDPPVGGGRVRIYNLYRFLPKSFEVTYVGTFDCKGAVYREQMLSGQLKEVLVPLTKFHFLLDDILKFFAGGKVVIDVTIPILLRFTPQYARVLREYSTNTDVLISSHPWIQPYLKRQKKQILVYDSHNCEYDIKTTLLANTPIGKCLCQLVKRVEMAACVESDAVLACSQEDKDAFIRHYNIPAEKIHIVPNGVPTEEIVPAKEDENRLAKKALGLTGSQTTLFIGSGGWPPNTEAAQFIIDRLAPELLEVTFFIVGSVKDSYFAANENVSNMPLNDVRFIDNLRPGVYLASGCYALEKWEKDVYFRWTQKETHFVVKDSNITNITLEIIPKARKMTVWVNGDKREGSSLRQDEKNIFNYEVANENVVKIKIKTTARRAAKEDPRYIGVALFDVCYVADGREKRFKMDAIPELSHTLPENVKLFGVVDEYTRKMIYKASDMALNPISKGSGTNIKMLDFMAAGLPVISTQLGARGINVKDKEDVLLCKLEDFKENIKLLLQSSELRKMLGWNARKIAVERYDWKVIGRQLAAFIEDILQQVKNSEANPS